MKHIGIIVSAILLVAGISAPCAADSRDSLALSLMPRVEDYTHMWWAEGFPGHTQGAPWRRVIQTGYYAMALDTDTLRVSHLGTVPRGVGYAGAARAGSQPWQELPPAGLKLMVTVDGKIYRCTAGGAWSQYKGPRIVESGRFLQRADVTDLIFQADDGTKLNVDARFETVAWPDRLSMILAARPGLLPIPAGEECFGRVGGGYGLDGTNHLEIPHSPEIDPEKFTLELWAFVPADYRPSERTFPWLVCKNKHEQAEGNYGIVILNAEAQARLNIGGGRENIFATDSHVQLGIEQWNHLAMSYDGVTLCLFVNGVRAGACEVGRKRVPGLDGLAIGRRQDNCGDGFHFRGVVDEIRIYDRALSPAEVRSRFQGPDDNGALKPVREWSFRADGKASLAHPRGVWKEASLDIGLIGQRGETHRHAVQKSQASEEWREAFVTVDADDIRLYTATGLGAYLRRILPGRAAPVQQAGVQAFELPGGSARQVEFDAARGWHRVNLDGIEPVVPPGGLEKKNDAIERVRLVLSNPADVEQAARLMFEKDAGGIRQRIGSAITGISAVLRFPDGQPTGIPVQLSKNWHGRPSAGVYAGEWFHGFSLVRLPPKASVELELALVYGNWGGVPAASHAQLCLIGWGSNQLWDESALGSWGENICYEPDQAQAHAAILDVRPVMVRSSANNMSWNWTHNVGGGDFFRLFDPAGKRVFPAGMRTVYHRQGPCLTEVTYAGRTGRGIEHSATVSIGRTDDILRGVYHLRLDVRQPVDFTRFVIFQIGADTYSSTGERKMALGNEKGLVKEWDTQWGGDTYRTPPMECTGRVPWISLHEAEARRGQEVHGAWANRGIVIRAWSARLGGKPAGAWIAEHGLRAHGTETSTLDIVPPPGVARLESGDFVEVTLEHIVMPQFAADYYGPNEALRAALSQWQNTWRMIHREAAGNDRHVEMKAGRLTGLYPAVSVDASGGSAEFTIAGGLGFVPVTFTGLAAPRNYELLLDGEPFSQGVHSNAFWQTDYDATAGCWSRTYNLPVSDKERHTVCFRQAR